MDIEYIKIIATVLGSGSAVSYLFFTVHKIWVAHINRHQFRKLTIKKGINGEYDINAEGLTVAEMTKLVQQSKNDDQKLIKKDK